MEPIAEYETALSLSPENPAIEQWLERARLFARNAAPGSNTQRPSP